MGLGAWLKRYPPLLEKPKNSISQSFLFGGHSLAGSPGTLANSPSKTMENAAQIYFERRDFQFNVFTIKPLADGLQTIDMTGLFQVL